MDLTQSQPKKPSLTSSNSCRRCRLKIPVSRRAQFYENYCRQQPFSFPDSLMHYIVKNPTSPALYKKSVKICKYFYDKNPILVLSEFWCNDDGEWYTFWSYSGGMHGLNLSSVSCKFWLTSNFTVYAKMIEDRTICSSIISKIYKCDAWSLTFAFQDISYDDFLFLASSVRYLDFEDVTVNYNDGSIVPLEKVIEALPKLTNLYYYDPESSSMSSKTFTELLKIPQFLALDYCKFGDLSETFDIEKFYTYMKQNQHTSILLGFVDSLSEAYQIRLEEIVDEILASEYEDFKLPYIYYPELDEERQDEILAAFQDQ